MPPDGRQNEQPASGPGRPGGDAEETIRRRSVERYRRHALHYDSSVDRTWAIREAAVARLALVPGDRVLDVGCGTGLSFDLLRAAVGDDGWVIGVEQSPEMAERARARIARKQWTNVCLIESAAHELVLDEPVDALLFNYTHDICQSRTALSALFGNARDGARVSLAGVKFMPWWVGPLNLYAYVKNLAYNGSAAGMARPWRHVLDWVPDLAVTSAQYGMAYLAHGRLGARPPADPRTG